jgi:hypothetical protein
MAHLSSRITSFFASTVEPSVLDDNPVAGGQITPAFVGKTHLHFEGCTWKRRQRQPTLRISGIMFQPANPPVFVKLQFFAGKESPPCHLSLALSQNRLSRDIPQNSVPHWNLHYPLVNVYITMERSTMLFMGKSTISTGPFSIAVCSFTRG